MEGFTVVLLISWLILVGCFVGMYFLDRATRQASRQRAKAAEQGTAQRR